MSDETYPDDVRLNLDEPGEVNTMEANDETTQVVEDAKKNDDEGSVDASETVRQDSDAGSACEACNGTGLSDYQNGRHATQLCQVCNGSGLI